MRVKRIVTDLFCCVSGSAVFSFALNMFAVPNDIVLGGLTGLGTIINHFFPTVPIGTAIFMMNVPLFVSAKVFLKKGALSKTVIATLIFSAFIDIGAELIPPYRGDIMLSCIFCGILSGLGLALVFLTGATTGGTDIIAMLIKSRKPTLSMGRVMLVSDGIIVLFSGVVYGEIEAILYALIVIFLTSRVIDFVLYGAEHSKMLMIVSDKNKEIADTIMSDFMRGVTFLEGKGGYSQKPKTILWCTVRASQVRNINRAVRDIDPDAFTVICDAGEVIGQGFTE
ncbi:MAG: YitT family protein [Clostridia bacterium]|nr:YitT family protein [Clostridia bacterium]